MTGPAAPAATIGLLAGAPATPVAVDDPTMIAASAGFIAVLLVVAPWMREGMPLSEPVAASLTGGMAAGYTFLVLLPEIDETNASLGDASYLIVLASFLAVFAGEHALAGDGPLAARRRDGRALYWLRLGLLWLYTFLVIATVPEVLHERSVHFLLVIGSASLHLVFEVDELADLHPRLHHRSGRWVLATAPVLAGILDLVLAEPPVTTMSVLTALMAGFMLLFSLAKRSFTHDGLRLGTFTAGAGIYVLIYFSRLL